ncbi:unnamed protein product [Bemisia tabaci]|uniref:Uncharacterized protein n=1 Tax=Bemisia tabaci TaxID=7038 RepID=A0A9P0F2N3_BEMTA|nr:unnamed protein product [Bemisia tabaci]
MLFPEPLNFYFNIRTAKKHGNHPRAKVGWRCGSCSMASGSEKAERSSEADNESEYESVDEDLVIPKKEEKEPRGEVEKPNVEEKEIETERSRRRLRRRK